MPIRNYGLKWSYDAGMIGKLPGGKPVDLSSQRGIYVLYRGDEISYVGKSVRGDNPGIYGRLIGHKEKKKRFKTYSWFGVSPVGDTGLIDHVAESLTLDELTTNLEPLLIYLLTPTGNKNGGDFKKIIRYDQCV